MITQPRWAQSCLNHVLDSTYISGYNSILYYMQCPKRCPSHAIVAPLLGGSCYTCHMGGIPTIRHNKIRDITATLLTDIYHNVATEPLLQPLTNESFAHRSANTEPNARLDICARGLWSTDQDAFFDVKVFYPNASSNCSMTTAAAYRKHESTKKRVCPTCS